jgi:hypothetical protein
MVCAQAGVQGTDQRNLTGPSRYSFDSRLAVGWLRCHDRLAVPVWKGLRMLYQMVGPGDVAR